VLLLPVNRAANAAGRIPGKLFELLRAGKPILSFSDTPGDVDSFIAKHNAGITTGYEDTEAICNFLNAQLASEASLRNTAHLVLLSNRALAAQVAGWLDEIVLHEHQTKES
jgi:hypothetical protein